MKRIVRLLFFMQGYKPFFCRDSKRLILSAELGGQIRTMKGIVLLVRGYLKYLASKYERVIAFERRLQSFPKILAPTTYPRRLGDSC